MSYEQKPDNLDSFIQAVNDTATNNPNPTRGLRSLHRLAHRHLKTIQSVGYVPKLYSLEDWGSACQYVDRAISEIRKYHA